MRHAAFALLASSLLLADCGATSVEPASDDTNTALDARLLGFWRIEDPKRARHEQPEAVVAIGRKQGSTTEMDLLIVELAVPKAEPEDGSKVAEPEIRMSRSALRATRIGGRAYASVPFTILGPLKEPAAAGTPPWFIVRYDMPDDATVNVRLMDDERVGTDVLEGLVEGKAERTGLGVRDVVLSASTPKLRKYLERRGDEVFRGEPNQVLKRIR